VTDLFGFVKDIKQGGACAFIFPNNGVIFGRLKGDEYTSLMGEVRKAYEERKAMNDRLVGHLQDEFEVSETGKKHLEEPILAAAHQHLSYFNHGGNVSLLTSSKPMKIGPLWVNFQKKHEFNPPHGHEGVYSFVIWMLIPYDLEEEKGVFETARRKMASMFGFIANDILGKSLVHPIPVDQSYEGVFCLFPSSLVHYVNPFYTSDDARISLSGNIMFDV